MKNVFQKFLSFLLLVLISFSSTFEVFAQNNFVNFSESLNISEQISDLQSKKEYQTEEEIKRDYDIVSEMNTPYGKMYYMKKKGEVSTRATFWDVVDIGMAISSWAKLFGEPNWENAGWAVLDTASLLPIIPSLRHVKNVEEATKAITNYAKKNKENMQKVVNAFKSGREGIQKIFRKLYFSKLLRFPIISIRRSQLERKFEHAAHLGLTKKTSLNGIKEPERTYLLNRFQDEIIKIIRNNQGIYAFSIRGLPTYTFVSNGKLVHLRRDNFEFLSAYPLTNNVKDALNGAIKIIPLNQINFNILR